MLGSAALLGNDDGGRFRSPENGLLFLSMLIKVKVFYFQIGVWLRRQNASLPPPCELLASWIPVLSGTSTACIPGSLSQKLPQAVENRVPTDTQPLPVPSGIIRQTSVAAGTHCPSTRDAVSHKEELLFALAFREWERHTTEIAQ